MIFTDRTITVRKGESRIDEPIVVYRGDYELEVRFTILNSRFKFMSGTNMIESEKASYGQLAILTPYGGNIFSDIVRCNDGSVTFVLTAEMLNQIEEVGLYSFQIRLMDYNKESRVSIPPVEFGIEVREPIASEDHDNSVNNAIVGYSIAKVVDPKEENVGDTFDESGNYNKTKWETGDRISEGKLNKIEDAIDTINQNEKNNLMSLGKRMDNNFNVLNSTKADKNEVFTMANMGQDVKEAMTGGSVAVVGRNAVDTVNINDEAVTLEKLSFSNKKNLFISTDITDNHFIMINNGLIVENSNYAFSDFIEVKTGVSYTFCMDAPLEHVVFYDENKNYIGGRGGSGAQIPVTIRMNDPKIKYLRVNINKTLISPGEYTVYDESKNELTNITIDGSSIIENTLDGAALVNNSIDETKLDTQSEFILNTFKNCIQTNNVPKFIFEYGIIMSDGTDGKIIDSAKPLNNVRSIGVTKVEKLRLSLSSTDIMVKIIYYDENGIFLSNSGWSSINPTNWGEGGDSYIDINDAFIRIAIASTTLNETGDFQYTIDEQVGKIKFISIEEGEKAQLLIPQEMIEPAKPVIFETANVVDGPMKLPAEFGDIPFDIIRKNGRYDISINMDCLNQNPTTIYVSSAGSETGLGDTKDRPITLRCVKKNLIANAYANKNIKILFMENIYFAAAPSDFDLIGTGQDSTVTNITFDSDCGFTWIGYGNRNIDWMQDDVNLNLFKYSTSNKVSDLVDLENLDYNGMPRLYIKKNNVDELTKEGCFCQVDGTVYVYPHRTNDIAKMNIIFGFEYSTDVAIPAIITIRKLSPGNIVFKNIGTLLDCMNLRDLRSLDVWIYMNNCRHHRGSMDAIAFDGKYKAVLIDCVSAYGSKDNFNYHSTSKDSVALELNCSSYGAGQYKLDTDGVNTTKDSCNGSTAHNGMCVARFGCSYWDCEGSVVADVNNCVSYCIECSVKNILPTISNANYKAAYMLHDNRFAGANPYRPIDNHLNYIINCSSGGENITWDIRSEGMYISVAGVEIDRVYMEDDNHISATKGDF